MKKTIAIILTLALALSLAACGSKNNGSAEVSPTPAPDTTAQPTAKPTETPAPTETPEPTEEPEETPEPTVEPTPAPTEAPKPTPAPTPAPTPEPTPEPTDDPLSNCTTLLSAVWADFDEDDKFPVAGGDYSNSVMDGPGGFALDAATLDSVLGMPESAVEFIDNAASLMHMMNANTFTCGAFHVSDSENVATVAQSLRDNIQARQWCCGFPERLVVISVGNYLISMFGNEEAVNNFVDHVAALFASASVLYNEAIA